jgi:hypothetical protein
LNEKQHAPVNRIKRKIMLRCVKRARHKVTGCKRQQWL